MRKELSKEERAAHTLLYAAELKASGKCATVKDAQKAGGKVGGSVAGKGRSKSGSQPAGGNPVAKPTTTQATATGLGITPNAVEKRVKAAAKAAGSDPVSIEKDTPETLRAVGEKALADPQGWARRINASMADSVAAIIATGQAFIDAKKALPHGQFERLFYNHPDPLPEPVNCTPATARMLMAIARYARAMSENG